MDNCRSCGNPGNLFPSTPRPLPPCPDAQQSSKPSKFKHPPIPSHSMATSASPIPVSYKLRYNSRSAKLPFHGAHARALYPRSMCKKATTANTSNISLIWHVIPDCISDNRKNCREAGKGPGTTGSLTGLQLNVRSIPRTPELRNEFQNAANPPLSISLSSKCNCKKVSPGLPLKPSASSGTAPEPISQFSKPRCSTRGRCRRPSSPAPREPIGLHCNRNVNESKGMSRSASTNPRVPLCET
mmetsp:Transcript_6602/g.15794  ORF Transcript_6602/g.15794 Transcript_6602/m.15794 type:complete len:242 (-) Transcript_6602:948-1673(-)